MERVVVNRTFTLRQTFYVDGVPADPTGTPTVAITRLSDGSAVATGAVTDEAAAGTWSVTVSATVNTLLDTLDVAWSGVVNTVAQEYRDTVEVAGDTAFTIDQALAVVPGATAPQVAEARVYAETEIERQLGYALVPRYHKQLLTGYWNTARLRVDRPLLRAIRSVTVNDVPLRPRSSPLCLSVPTGTSPVIRGRRRTSGGCRTS